MPYIKYGKPIASIVNPSKVTDYNKMYRRHLAAYLWNQRSETKPLINLSVGTVYSLTSAFVPEPYRSVISNDRANRQLVVENILSDGTVVNITTTNSRHVRVIPNKSAARRASS